MQNSVILTRLKVDSKFMGINNLSVSVYTERTSLRNKISATVATGRRKISFFTDPEKIFGLSLSKNESHVFIIDLIENIPLNKFKKLVSSNQRLEIIFILKEYTPRIINSIVKNDRFDFVIEGPSFAVLLNKKINSLHKLHMQQSPAQKRNKNLRNEYSNLLDNMIIGLYRTTPDGKVIMLNRAALKLVGCKSMKEVKKVDLEDEYFDPYKLRKIFKQQLNENGFVVDFENRWRRPDGKLMIVRENAKAIKDKKGNLLYYEGTFEDITSSIETKRALIESEKKLHLTLQAANIGFWNWSIKSNEIFFSPEFSKMLGYEPEELSFNIDTFINLFYAEDRHIILKDLLADVNVNQPDFETEVRMTSKSGEIRWMFTKGKVLEWTGSVPLNIIAIQIDITDRKTAEATIKESETRFRELAENIEEMFWLSTDKEILYISPGMEKIWGFTSPNIKVLLPALYRTLHKEDKNRIKRAIKLEVAKGPGIFNEEFRIIRPDGGERWIWARTFPVKKGNEIYRSVGIAEDITTIKRLQIELEEFKNDLQHTVDLRTSELLELNQRLTGEISKQKIAEEKIENQLKFFRTLIETAASPMFIKDTEKKYIDCNKAFEEYFGDLRENIIGKSDSEFIPAEIAAKFESIDDALLKNPGEITYEGVTKHNSPYRKEFMITKSTFLKADGKPGGIIAFVTDITQKKKLELNIHKAMNKEKELLELKSKLISTASHEFRTPLTTILSSIDLVDVYRKKENSEKYYSHIEKVKTSVKYMIELLNDVMVINKTESGKLEFTPSETDLIDLCTEIIAETRQVLGNDIKIVFSHKSITGKNFVDKKLLKLILSNLLNNAVKYSHENGIVNFSLSLNSVIDFRIEDHGLGIPQEQYPMIYEPFQRGGNVLELPGTGLGLSIVKRCVDLHKGKIQFESRLNKGTVFNVQIPIINA